MTSYCTIYTQETGRPCLQKKVDKSVTLTPLRFVPVRHASDPA